MGKLIKGKNDLYTWCINNGEHGKKVLESWVGLDEYGYLVDIHNITQGSNKVVQWKCENGHKYKRMIYDVTHSKMKCPHCIKTLSTWSNENGSWGNQIKSEWVGFDENYTPVSFDNISYGSNKKVYWKCSKGHCWIASVHNRTCNNSGCPYCKVLGTSYPEQYIFNCLKQIFPDTENRCKVLKDKYSGGIEFDIGIPCIRTCIEYSATCWHKDRIERDNLKINICKENNVRLIRIIEDSYNEMQESEAEDTIVFRMIHSRKNETLNEVIEKLFKMLNIAEKLRLVDFYKVALESDKFAHKQSVRYEKSLEFNEKELLKEWNYTLNKVNPSEISVHSHIKAYWICHKCGYGSNGEWHTYVYSRTATRGGSGCPKCGYNYRKDKGEKE